MYRARPMKTGLNAMLDPSRRSGDAEDFDKALRRRIVGQDEAIEKVTEVYQMFLAGLNPPGRPVGNLLFLGPTGSGKTRVVEAMAEALFGDARAVVDRIRSGAVDAVIVLGHDALQEGLLGSEQALAGLDTVILLDTHASELQRVAHVIVPVRHAAEKLGSFVNAARRVQRAVPAVESGWETFADGEVIARLGAALGLEGFDGSYDVHSVARELAATHAAFAGIDLDTIGDAGRPLAESARPRTER